MKIKVYTKDNISERYPLALAGSIHFSFMEEKEWKELNMGVGMLYAKASVNERNTIEPKNLRNPKIYQDGDSYLIFAQELDELGTPTSPDEVILFQTKDFVSFEEQIKVSKTEYARQLLEAREEIDISEEMLTKIKNRWYPLCRIKKIDFPMAVGFADPVIFAFGGAWYFLATNDNVEDIGLFIRKADSVKGLFEEGIETHCILDYNEEKGWIQTFWAPEFHVIGGEAYILFALGGKQWAPQCHMMRLKRGGDLTKASDWEEPIRVLRQDGSFLTEDGITLDMTYFKAKDISYLAWSYRYGINSDYDTGSMIYIATIDEKKPWILTSEPVLLSRPLFGWENIQGTINNEGPYPLVLEDKVYLSFSGGAACGYTYAVGYLIADVDADLLDCKNWKKEPAPVLCSNFIPGIQGPGHNSFFYNEEGELMVAYHAQETERHHKRCTTMHRVHIGVDGFPHLNMSI